MLVSFLDQLSAIDSFLQQARHYLTLHWCVTAHCLKNTATLHVLSAQTFFFFSSWLMPQDFTGFVCEWLAAPTRCLRWAVSSVCLPQLWLVPSLWCSPARRAPGRALSWRSSWRSLTTCSASASPVSVQLAFAVEAWVQLKKGFTYLLHLLLSEDGLHVCLKLLKQVNPENTTLSYSDHFSRYW